MTRRFPFQVYAADGTLLDQGETVVEETVQEVNRRTIEDSARNALATNREYIARANPTAAQNAAQIKALTRQMNALIRLSLNSLDGTD